MKRYKILLFILAVIAALGAVCCFFPEDGVRIKGITLRFASLEDILREEKIDVPQISPEDILEREKQAILFAQKDSIENFLNNNSTRFHFPDQDNSFFDSLFIAFEGADSTKIRVVHYGDSQIEEDRITHVIRDSLQKYFGGNGQGMMPARTYYTFSTAGSSSAEPERFMIYANKSDDRQYGPYADFIRINDSLDLDLTYYSIGNKRITRQKFNQVTVLAGNTKGDGLRIACGKSSATFSANEQYVRAIFDVSDNSQKVNINISGSGDIYGVLLDNRTGIAMDNVPMRGCSGIIFTSMDDGQLKDFYREENVRLILLQYGGNRVPNIHNSTHISRFCTQTKRQIRKVRELAPQATVIYLGPSDMSTSIKGKMQTYPILPELIDSLKHSVTSCGAAYWDIYSAMGGKNSMLAWVKANPPLASTDHIHFSPKGSILMGELFFESFKLYYDYYIWRKENEK